LHAGTIARLRATRIPVMSELFFINILLELERVAPGFASPLGFNGLRSC
jgi:hypothetical protein